MKEHKNGKSRNSQYDYLVIGAGPAGLQMGYYLEKAGRNYIILEAGEGPATFFKSFPRHRKLISINKVYTGCDDSEINLRWDWNSLLSDSEEMLFKRYSEEYFPPADKMVDYLADFATHFDLKIKYGVEVTKIGKNANDEFEVADRKRNRYSGKRLIIASGVSKPYVPPIPGIELAELYTEVSVDPAEFKNQRVLIIGKGNSGFETADNLIGTAAMIHIASPSPLTLAWKSKFVGHLRAVNNNFLDTYQLKSQNVMLDAFVDKIVRHDDRYEVTVSYTHAAEEVETLTYDRVIVCAGFRFDDSIFDQTCKPLMTINDRFPAQTSAWESPNVKDLYFAGTLMQMRDFKKKQSGFIHGFRYNVRALHRILERRHHGNEWPSRRFKATPKEISNALISRVNKNSGLWQQTGLLCDMIILPNHNEEAQYYEEIPSDFVHDSDFGQHARYYLLTLEFGQDIIDKSPDPLAIERIHKDDVGRAQLSTGLHPIIRRYSGSKLISEHHVIEDIASEWLEDVHSRPLLNYLEREFAEGARA